MIKKITSIALLFCFITSFSGVYIMDNNSFSKEFENLDKIESEYFEHKKNNTIEEYKQEFLEGPIVSADPFAVNNVNEFYFDFEGFAWGFCCCPIGFFVVAVNDNKDEDQKKSYWIGVVAGVALNILVGLGSLASTSI